MPEEDFQWWENPEETAEADAEEVRLMIRETFARLERMENTINDQLHGLTIKTNLILLACVAIVVLGHFL
ncbi:MAG: hypothetical protein E5V92_01885 [Mesorhizobium sp.]|uniref:hypothetical protein n=1 Tax=unclassified Mesorhizobium TaxID=325217 RepID=UPI000F750A8A|nr:MULTISPECIES: hypothetical protein [unclassified Mesorhizobium]AZO75035.1 hypothetical protein EJ067_30575 [Mesorhizobium sp. M1D.F.Ca.ET.043.01.1.1]RWA96094.1 MAG: hypothetical protein EOQ32_00300 [Mesorhizobium sp.]TJW90374.1 MAG: hypothetical protein E5V92_01885 [Mesorhizobium sp.]